MNSIQLQQKGCSTCLRCVYCRLLPPIACNMQCEVQNNFNRDYFYTINTQKVVERSLQNHLSKVFEFMLFNDF